MKPLLEYSSLSTLVSKDSRSEFCCWPGRPKLRASRPWATGVGALVSPLTQGEPACVVPLKSELSVLLAYLLSKRGRVGAGSGGKQSSSMPSLGLSFSLGEGVVILELL